MNQTDLKHKLSAPFDFNEWKNILAQMFPKIDYLAKETSVDNNLVKNGGQIGVIHLNDGRSLGLFKFEVADNIHISRNRKGLREIAAKYVDQDIINGALVLYYSGIQTEYRLTFVSKQTVFDSEGNLSIKETAPKRYTFLLGESEPCTTAANRLIELINKNKRGSVYLDDVTEAFSVERLNKDFFNGYKTQYKRFVDTLTYTLKNENNELVNVDGLMIGECIIKAKEMYTKIGFDIDLLDELDIHRTQSLNPSSHHNPQSNFYKLELKRTFEIIRLLQEYKIVQLIKKDNNITFSVNCEDGFIYNYEVQILDDILVYKKPNNPYFVNLADKRKYAVEKCNGKKAGHTTNGFSLQEFYDDTIRGLIENIHKNPIVEKDVLDIFKYNGRSINELLAEMNN